MNAAPDVKKRMIGEKIYPVVLDKTNAKIAGKVTGMLLEMPEPDLIELVKNEPKLVQRVQEAKDVLRKAWEDNPEALKELDS